MQQVKEPHARLWREKPADRAGLTQQLMSYFRHTHTGWDQAGKVEGTNPFFSSYLERPVARAQAGGRLGWGWAQPSSHGEPCAKVNSQYTLTPEPNTS